MVPRAGYGLWSPDGKRIVYLSGLESSFGIHVINADGTQNRKLTSNGFFPLWSPDGTKIAYTSVEQNIADGIRMITLDVTETTPASTFSGIEHPSPSEKRGIPGFEIIFAIAGVLAIAYLLRRGKWVQQNE